MGRKRTIRIGATVGFVAGLYTLWKEVASVGASEKGARAVVRLTGYNMSDGSWDIKRATAALPMIAGIGLSMVASKTGMNRYTPTGINL